MQVFKTTQENIDHRLIVGVTEGGGQPMLHIKQHYAGTTKNIGNGISFVFKDEAQLEELIDVLRGFSASER
jgi:hypothetical protein